jgi:hypothetical protein
MVAGLFWPRSLDVGGSAELPGAMYGALPVPAIDVLREWLPPSWPVIPCNTQGTALEILATNLQEFGTLALRFPEAGLARSEIRTILENPLEVGTLFVYPRVMSVVSCSEGIEVVVTAPELEL